MEKGRLRKVGRVLATWLPAIPLVMAFGAQGLAKFSETSGWTSAFHHWGYPDWFRMTVGVVEMAAAACLLWGRTAVIGASLILVVMAGAMATKVIQDGGSHVTSDILPSAFALLILFMRREQLRALFSYRR